MKKDFIGCDAIVNEWLTDNDFQGKVEEDLLRRWASRRAESFIDTEQLVFDVALIDIKHFAGTLPDGFHSVYLVAGTDDMSKCWNREQLVGYTQEIYGTDCDLDIKINCPKCRHEKCTCDTKALAINVDEVYLRERPYLWEMTNRKYLGYNSVVTDGYPCAAFDRNFFIMTPRATNAALWNSEYFLGVCNSIGQACSYTYDLNPPEILTNMKEGQIYMAYLKYNKDEDGYYMIPNFPECIEAISAYMSEQYLKRIWNKDGNQSDRLRWLDAKRESDLLLGQVKNKLETPDPEKWMKILSRQWIQGRERFHYG